jgi:glyoxylase-like metal-dependent hydrolase (beta-lactamase superfamily II)
VTALPVDQVGARCWAVETRHVGGKVGVVVGDVRTLVIDAGADPTEGAAVAATAAGRSRGPVSLVLTHGHWDHVRGLAGMRDVEVLVHEDAWPSACSQLRVTRRMTGASETAGHSVTTFVGARSIDLGGVTVEVIEAPGHAPGSVCIRVMEDGVLFGGDTVVTAIPPVFTDGHSTILERTLRHLAAIEAEVAVPGHGRVVRGPSRVRAGLERSADLIAHTRERVEAMFGPSDADDVVAALPLRGEGMFDAGIVSKVDLEARHERMVRALIGEMGLRPAGASSV